MQKQETEIVHLNGTRKRKEKREKRKDIKRKEENKKG